MITEKIEVSFQTEDQMMEFKEMLAWMELCGNIGHSTEFKVFLNGNGVARPKFIYDDPDEQKFHEDLRKAMVKCLETVERDVEKIHGFKFR